MKKIIVISLLFVLLVSPFAAKALTKQEQINILIQMIANIQAQINALLAAQSSSTTGACVVNWQCGEWTVCSNLTQSRLCSDANKCGSISGKPVESQSCTLPTANTAINLAVDNNYSAVSIIIPQTNFKIGEFILANNTTEAININSIEIDLLTGTNDYANSQYISNLYAKIGDSTIMAKDTTERYNYWTTNLQLPANKTETVSVFANINSALPITSTITSKLLVEGITSKSNIAVYTNSGEVFEGQTVTFGASSLIISKGTASPSAGLVVAGQQMFAGEIKFEASRDSFNINDLKLIVSDPAAASLISDAYLIDSLTGAQIGQKTGILQLNNNMKTISFSGLKFTVPLNTSKSLKIYYNLKDVNSAETVAGIYKNAAPILVYVKAINSKETIDGSAGDYSGVISENDGSITLPASGLVFNEVYILKSIPKITVKSTSANAKSGSILNLYDFNISADAKSDIAVKQLIFKIKLTALNFGDLTLRNFKLYKNGINYNNYVSIKSEENSIGTDIKSLNKLSFGDRYVAVTFDTEENIPAGTSQNYSLQATIENFKSSTTYGSDYISVYLQPDGDRTIQNCLRDAIGTGIFGLAVNPIAQAVSVNYYNFIWSDKSSAWASFGNHGYLNGSSSSDWHNGYGLWDSVFSYQTITASN
jgi:hypothetical protein